MWTGTNKVYRTLVLSCCTSRLLQRHGRMFDLDQMVLCLIPDRGFKIYYQSVTKKNTITWFSETIKTAELFTTLCINTTLEYTRHSPNKK